MYKGGSLKSDALDKFLGGIELGKNILASIQQLPHFVIFTNLTAFVGATGRPTLPMKMLRRIDLQDIVKQPTPEVMLYLKAKVIIRTISILTAAIHKYLFVPVTASATIDRQTLTDALPWCVSALGSSLSALDEHLADAAVSGMEAQAWSMPTSWSVMRLWQRTIATIRLRSVQVVLLQWNSLLDDMVAKSKSICPTWGICYADGTWNDRAADRLLLGKMSVVSASRNSLHDLLTVLNEGANRMEVTPRLQENEVSAQSIAVALHTLGRLKQTFIVASGVSLMHAYKFHHMATVKASEFLKVHKDARADANGIPNLFWKHIESMAAQGARPAHERPASPPDGASAASAPVATAASTTPSATGHVMAAPVPHGPPEYQRASGDSEAGAPARGKALKRRRM